MPATTVSLLDSIYSNSLHGPVRELHQDNGISNQINQSIVDRPPPICQFFGCKPSPIHQHFPKKAPMKPTLVLVHGSWHGPKHFGPLIQFLEGHDYKCVPVSLPTTQDPSTPPHSFQDDTDAVRNTVLSELDGSDTWQGNDVVVIAHSYGGMPTMNALANLCAAARTGAGKPTSVRAVGLICAGFAEYGKSFVSYIGGKPLPIHDLRGDFCYVGPPGPEAIFYNDLTEVEAKRWSAMLRPQAWRAFEDPVTFEGYLEIPTSYLFCTKDQGLPYEGQKALVGMAEAKGVKFRTEEVESGHSPFLSMPERTGNFVRRTAGEDV
jgi:pimeloyl-ACP methyl ester carboxylesterase